MYIDLVLKLWPILFINGNPFKKFTFFYKKDTFLLLNRECYCFLYIPKSLDKKKFSAVIACHPNVEFGKLIVDDRCQIETGNIGKKPAEREHIFMISDNLSYNNLKGFDFENDRYESGKLNMILRNFTSKSITKKSKPV